MGKFGEINSADTHAVKFPLVPMGGLAEGPACADTGARTPIGASGIINANLLIFLLYILSILQLDKSNNVWDLFFKLIFLWFLSHIHKGLHSFSCK